MVINNQMEKEKQNKIILDSVHGYIAVPNNYCEKIIDSIYFQRLRRIEQTSGRSLFPCARHDRFVHSLGVYHLGCKIIDVVLDNINIKDKDFRKKYSNVITSYKLACLLHDIGHSPFSHTFEVYYGNTYSLDDNHNLREMLVDIIDDNDTKNDINKLIKLTEHEFMSAYIAVKQFGDAIEELGGDKGLVARMIIGCKYSGDKQNCFADALIDLIHGDVLDADSLDYVCRDSWASGYSAEPVDIERLISSIRIHYKDNKFQVCFTPKALNEISKALEIKTFQQLNVIHHHTVVYEQKLLVEAMKSAAAYHQDYTNPTDEQRLKALTEICVLDSMIGGIELKKHRIPLRYPMDDDFVSLMKYCTDDKYIKQWLSREYQLKPLWKNTAEFYANFQILRGKKLEKGSWIFSDRCRDFISEKFNINKEDVWIEEATPKYRSKFADKVMLLINNEIIQYETLLPKDKNSFSPDIPTFCYIYTPSDDKKGILQELNKELSLYIFNQ